MNRTWRDGAVPCRDVQECLTEYMEDTLASADRRQLEAHLAGCPRCRDALAGMRLAVRVAGQLREDRVSGITRRRLIHVFRAWKAGIRW